MEDIQIRGDMIRLGQLLKHAGIAEDGAHAKDILAAGHVIVNGQREDRRGRQLVDGDEVNVEGTKLRVVANG